ncbi:hypothetical protein D8S78_13455 [Natrialba swarupiae]|nr:hypothetical protein [Natrialba swarupiae]
MVRVDPQSTLVEVQGFVGRLSAALDIGAHIGAVSRDELGRGRARCYAPLIDSLLQSAKGDLNNAETFRVVRSAHVPGCDSSTSNPRPAFQRDGRLTTFVVLCR